MADIKQVRRLQSTSFVGRSVVQVTTLDAVTDVDAIWDKVRAELKLIESDLPDGCQRPLVNDKFGDTAAMVVALYQEPKSAEVRRYTSRELEIFSKRLRDRAKARIARFSALVVFGAIDLAAPLVQQDMPADLRAEWFADFIYLHLTQGLRDAGAIGVGFEPSQVAA